MFWVAACPLLALAGGFDLSLDTADLVIFDVFDVFGLPPIVWGEDLAAVPALPAFGDVIFEAPPLRINALLLLGATVGFPVLVVELGLAAPPRNVDG